MAKKGLTDMMKQYEAIKTEHADCIVFYRLGDFYEMFNEDAIVASKILDLTLTGRNCGLEERAPMCGIPYHASQQYIAKLINAGKKIAVVEQLTKPGEANIIVRDVVKIITPGTVLVDSCLDDKTNNYIAGVYACKQGLAICWADISTGEIEVSEFFGDSAVKILDDALAKLKPAEVICNKDASSLQNDLISTRNGNAPSFTTYTESAFSYTACVLAIKEQFNVKSLSVFDLENKKLAVCAVGALLSYLSETQKQTLSNLKNIAMFYDGNFMHLDVNARKNLELTENMTTRKKQGSLLGLLDKTNTSMGARKIRNAIENPLYNSAEINLRLDAVEELTKNLLVRETSSELFSQIGDIERLCSKIATTIETPKDCYTLGVSLEIIPKLKEMFLGCNSPLIKNKIDKLIDCKDVYSLLLKAFDDKAPVNFKEGGFFKFGFNEKLDSYKNVSSNGLQWITNFEQEERAKTGIKNLKVSYNKVFGYYIEVTKSYYNLIPENYMLRQTTLDSQKFVTPELKEAERIVLTGSEQLKVYELELFDEIRRMLLTKIKMFQDIAEAVAVLDMLVSFAKVSVSNSYTKPRINDDINEINITGGRHPVIESLVKGQFTANDTLLDNNENNIMIITGPNMGGKSTYMRQVALITIMAHIGCFVPATKAIIPLTDRIFTRIGASDEITLGNSTFMVEMTEMSNIISCATSKSLLILDEVGRGTSTFDGLSIAWAIIEYISKNINAKTLFATHYHELIALEEKMVGVKNYRVLVKEYNNSIIFLHKIARGSANRSFGIEVAGLAGLPESLITRAKQVLIAQENADRKVDLQTAAGIEKPTINPNAVEVINVLKEMDMNTISPLEAFGTLQNLIDKVKKD